MNKTILILAEHLKGKLSDCTFEMLGKALEIAKQINAKISVLLIGNKIENLSAQLGQADDIIYIESENLAEFLPEAYSEITMQQIEELKPRIAMIAATSVGLDVSSLVSARMKLPLVSSCKAIEVEGDKIVVMNQLYGGKMVAESDLPEQQVIVSILPGAFRAEKGKSNKPANVRKLAYKTAINNFRTKFERMVEPESGDIDITQIPVLVSVGRGIQNQDNIPLAQELADVIGGAVSASRPVVDQGWIQSTRQVGRSGMTVKAKLYLALGISGAPEHVEGMKDSELIVAVNTDPKAPIFNIAHYGAIADVLDLIPVLKDTISQKKG